MTKDEFCRICDRKLPSQAKEKSTWYPFCSQRCRWMDLGKWFNEEYGLAEGKDPPDAPDSEL
jgi:endogenous inhibitor of DNA gyrase (YacG/DUF329 family)